MPSVRQCVTLGMLARASVWHVLWCVTTDQSLALRKAHTFCRVIEALQSDTALCCCLAGCSCAVIGWQCNDGHLIQCALEGVQQPAQQDDTQTHSSVFDTQHQEKSRARSNMERSCAYGFMAVTRWPWCSQSVQAWSIQVRALKCLSDTTATLVEPHQHYCPCQA